MGIEPVLIVAIARSLWPGSPATLRACLAMLVLIAPSAFRTLAYAKPPDPCWAQGIYNDADLDNVIGYAASRAGHVSPTAPTAPPPASFAVPGWPRPPSACGRRRRARASIRALRPPSPSLRSPESQTDTRRRSVT